MILRSKSKSSTIPKAIYEMLYCFKSLFWRMYQSSRSIAYVDSFLNSIRRRRRRWTRCCGSLCGCWFTWPSPSSCIGPSHGRRRITSCLYYRYGLVARYLDRYPLPIRRPPVMGKTCQRLIFDCLTLIRMGRPRWQNEFAPNMWNRNSMWGDMGHLNNHAPPICSYWQFMLWEML